MPNTMPNLIPSHTYNADTAQAIRDQSLVVQQSFKRGMTVPNLQQCLTLTSAVLEVQERSTVKHILQLGRLAIEKCTQRSDGKCTYR
jgi:hypothetical protein